MNGFPIPSGILSSASFSLGHGGNDSQKVMGIIGAAYIFYEKQNGNSLTFTDFVNTHLWVPVASFLAIGIGTMSGGWRIIKTMGGRLTRLKPRSGFCAETAAGLAMYAAKLKMHRDTRRRAPGLLGLVFR
jgi:PiT family inorganic phosphate transporter